MGPIPRKTKSLLTFIVFLCLECVYGQSSAVLYVNGSTGADTNPGTATLPLKTINRAVDFVNDNLLNNVSSTIIISPGVYRESILLEEAGLDIVPSVTIQAAQNGTVVVSGADVWTGWQPYASNPAVFVHAWPYRWGLCPQPAGWPALPPAVLRREMIAVNGAAMRQVFSLAQLAPGSFYVDEAGQTVYLQPLAGTNLNAATVEVAVRPRLLQGTAPQNLSLKGLTFQHANTCTPDAAVQLESVSSFYGQNLLIEDSTFQSNNWSGLSINTAYGVTVRRVVARNNGGAGMYGYAIKNALYEDDEGSYNNWRGAMGGFLGWDPAGGKFFSIHGGVFRNWKAFSNQARGLWFDTDNADVTVDNAVISQNKVDGIFIEASQGPLSVVNSKICANATAVDDGGGIVNANSHHVTVSGTLLYNNNGPQILISGDTGGRIEYNWETNQQMNLFASNWTLLQNTIVGASAAQYALGTTLPSGSDWSKFITTLLSNNNVWYNAGTPNVYQLPAGMTDLSGWRVASGQDVSSVFASPSVDFNSACGGERARTGLSAVPQARSIVAGDSTTFTLSGSSGGAAGLSDLSVTGLPAGATSAFTPSADATYTVLTVRTTPATAAGTYVLNVNGAINWLPALPAMISLTINPAAAASVSLVSTPSSRSVAIGETATYSIGINRGAFAGPVSLSVANLPTGASASFSPNPATGNTSILTVQTKPNTPVGESSLVISGSASGASVNRVNAVLAVSLPMLAMSQPRSGFLSSGSGADAALPGAYKADYALTGVVAGQRVQIDLLSAFDNFLQIINAATGVRLFDSDDTGAGTNSRVTFTVKSGIPYLIRVSSYAPGQTGTYTLGIQPGKPARDAFVQ